MVFLVLEGDILSEANSNNLLNKIKYLEMLSTCGILRAHGRAYILYNAVIIGLESCPLERGRMIIIAQPAAGWQPIPRRRNDTHIQTKQQEYRYWLRRRKYSSTLYLYLVRRPSKTHSKIITHSHDQFLPDDDIHPSQLLPNHC